MNDVDHHPPVNEKQSSLLSRIKPQAKSSGESLLQKRKIQTNFMCEKDGLKTGGIENRDSFGDQNSGSLMIHVSRSRAQSETIITNFDETQYRLSNRANPQTDLANGSFDVPILDTFCFGSFSNVNESDSLYQPEEVRIYKYLDQLSVNPVDVGQYLKEARMYS